jgi:hypothetical protein
MAITLDNPPVSGANHALRTTIVEGRPRAGRLGQRVV